MSSQKHSAPAYTIRTVAGVPESDTVRPPGPCSHDPTTAIGHRPLEPAVQASPGPAQYVTRVRTRFGGGQMGDAPCYSISQRQAPEHRFISRQHAYSQQGTHSPGPATYTPREMTGVVNYTNSNTSTHAPTFSFGSEKRPYQNA